MSKPYNVYTAMCSYLQALWEAHILTISKRVILKTLEEEIIRYK